MADAPSAFIGHAGLTLDFLGRDAVARTCHQIHGEEPNRQLGWRLVKDRVCARIDMVAALLASEGSALVHHVKIRLDAARWAKNLGPAVVNLHQLSEARRVVGIFGLELFESVFGHGRRSPCG